MYADKSILTKRYHLPFLREAETGIQRLSLTEFALFSILTASLFISTIALFFRMNESLLVEIPVSGGSLREGIVGSPRFVNPILALTDADRDLSALVYSGLLKSSPSGKLIPDLAEAYTISEDGLTYTFTLREDAVFHDGEPVTADDILFTIEKAQDNRVKSPKRAVWDGVGVEKTDRWHVVFTLTQPYAPFLENTTIGILPRHIWKDADPEQFAFSQFNIEPIGSGPYRIKTMRRNESGVPVSYSLESFSKYTLGEPKVRKMTITFYPNDQTLLEAYRSGAIESVNFIAGIGTREVIQKDADIQSAALPRIFAVFFNQNQSPIFAHQELREALSTALDREAILNEAFDGYGKPIDGPIPPGLLSYPPPNEISASENIEKRTAIKRAAAILEKNGWKIDVKTGVRSKTTGKSTEALEFSLATSDAPELKHVANIIEETWERIGAHVTLNIYETGDLNQNVIRPRAYDALLFGEVIGRDLDLYAFWHSSQRNDPGLNIALYANITADKLLEEARGTTDMSIYDKRYDAFLKEIKRDIPAVFLYTPELAYVTPQKLRGVALGSVIDRPERFANVHEWYIETENVWELFVPGQ